MRKQEKRKEKRATAAKEGPWLARTGQREASLARSEAARPGSLAFVEKARWAFGPSARDLGPAPAPAEPSGLRASRPCCQPHEGPAALVVDRGGRSMRSNLDLDEMVWF
jgi:hypothetical protein